MNYDRRNRHGGDVDHHSMGGAANLSPGKETLISKLPLIGPQASVIQRKEPSSLAPTEQHQPSMGMQSIGAAGNGHGLPPPKQGAAAPAEPFGSLGKGAYNDLKAELVSTATSRMLLAYTAFSSACQYVGASIKAKAKSNAELFSAFVEIGLGFMLPGLSAGLGRLIGQIPITLTAEAKQFMESAYLNLSNTDLAKALIQGATKAATTEIKLHSSELFGDTTVERFVRALQVQFQAGFQTTIEGLKNQSMEAITAICAAFDYKATNVETYTTAVNELVSRFETEVEPIHPTEIKPDHTGTGMLQITERVTAHWLYDKSNPSQGSYLAICRQLNAKMGFIDQEPVMQFVTWVSKDMKDMALGRTSKANQKDEPGKPGGPRKLELHQVSSAPSTVPADSAQFAREQ